MEEGSRHHGPIYAIERNYFLPKAILTVGDWASRLWMEDVKTPIMSTRYEKSYLTSGCWSPTRPGVFFNTKADGELDVWDYYYDQTQPVYQLKVSESPLSAIALQTSGKVAAVGCKDGSITLLELCASLTEPSGQEKNAINLLFEREMSREKNLQAKMLANRRLKQGSRHSQKQVKIISKNKKDFFCFFIFLDLVINLFIDYF